MRFQEVTRFLLLLLLPVLGVLRAADITGKWVGTSESGTEMVLDLKTEGAKLTGTATLNGDKSAISEGRIEEDRISFSMPSLYGGGTVVATGKLDRDELRVSLTTPVGPVKASLKKQ